MKNPIIPSLLLSGLLLLGFNNLFSQSGTFNYDRRPIITAVPFLLISPDARSASMAGVGVSTSPDNYSYYVNPAKYAFIDKELGVALSLHNDYKIPFRDFNLPSATLYYKPDDKSAVAWSFQRLSLGKTTIRNLAGNLETFKPRDYAISTAYSRKLGEHLSGAMAVRYINSRMMTFMPLPVEAESTASAIAADLALFYNRNVELWNNKAVVSWGINISNIGTKLSYFEGYKDFLPTNLRIGPGLAFHFNDQISSAFFVDFNKLLVPTPPVYELDDFGQPVFDNEGQQKILRGKDRNVSVLRGIYQSFYDAPDGFSEEMQEISVGFGMEHTLRLDDFAIDLRAGYFYEHENKGNRRHFTTGLGITYKFVNLSYTYLFATPQSPVFYNAGWITLSCGFNTR